MLLCCFPCLIQKDPATCGLSKNIILTTEISITYYLSAALTILDAWKVNSIEPSPVLVWLRNPSWILVGGGGHAMPYYIKIVFSCRHHWLVVLIPRRLEVQINSNVADQGKYTIKTSAYQIYDRRRIKYIRVTEGLVCFFTLKFDIIAVGSTITPRITKYEGNLIFQWRASLNSENF